MQHLIAEYLFFKQKCSLPGIGELRVLNRHAAYAQGDQLMHAPVAEIHLMDSNVFDNGLIEFIARATGITETDARKHLNRFCDGLRVAGKETLLPFLGTFVADADGKMSFQGVETHSGLWAPVPAERVVRRDNHQILVGDTESDSEKMTAYYATPNNTARSWWWVWALVLFLMAAVAITYYMIDGRYRPGMGNTQSIPEVHAPKTYEVSP
ncbi:MAG: hypothetical protein KF880_01950 [Ferruginibacter sp.]|nr:hypothetical protein [Ferruginibacter sp.]